MKSPDLAERIVNNLATCGVVGESINLLTGYLAGTSQQAEQAVGGVDTEQLGGQHYVLFNR